MYSSMYSRSTSTVIIPLSVCSAQSMLYALNSAAKSSNVYDILNKETPDLSSIVYFYCRYTVTNQRGFNHALLAARNN